MKLSPQDEIKIHLQQISSYFIIAGTNEGQIIYFDKENGESKKIIQVKKYIYKYIYAYKLNQELYILMIRKTKKKKKKKY